MTNKKDVSVEGPMPLGEGALHLERVECIAKTVVEE